MSVLAPTEINSEPIDTLVKTVARVSGLDITALRGEVELALDRGVSPLRGLMSGGVTISALRLAAWAHRGHSIADLYPIDPTLASAIPFALAKRNRMLAYKQDGDTTLIAVADPEDLSCQDVARKLFRVFRFDVADGAEILEALRATERSETLARAGGAVAQANETTLSDVRVGNQGATSEEELSEGTIGKLLAEVIRQALLAGASDIHFEPTEYDMKIRVRIDSVLHQLDSHPLTIAGQLMGRLKVLAGLDLGERRVPQDGRFQTTLDERQIDMRVATVPTTWGMEGAVIRLLDRGNRVATLQELGFSKLALASYDKLQRSGTGAVLVTGPTGSGKTSTLYATINTIADPTVKVVTIEDPVEFRFAGITQVQVNAKAGLTYASAMRSFLRCDPDIILVGEVRDHETASTMIEAALTGHLVFGTIHTNSAAATPIRLSEMGIDGYLVASALRGVVAQRLVRKLCIECREAYSPTTESLATMGWRGPAPDSIYRAREHGCAACSRTGYRGRIAVAEVLVIDEELERLISQNLPSEDIARTAMKNGFVPMRADGLAKVAAGGTSLAELARVLGGTSE